MDILNKELAYPARKRYMAENDLHCGPLDVIYHPQVGFHLDSDLRGSPKNYFTEENGFWPSYVPPETYNTLQMDHDTDEPEATAQSLNTAAPGQYEQITAGPTFDRDAMLT